MITLLHGDCLEKMAEIPDGSVDMVLTDPPYGTTACKWDSIIPLEPMWEHLKRVIKPNGAIVMTASQPFTTTLIASNMKMFKYCWVWEKSQATGFLNAKKRPMVKHEDVVVFYAKQARFNRQFVDKKIENIRPKAKSKPFKPRDCYGSFFDGDFREQPENKLTPLSILQINNEKRGRGIKRYHPTQKPVALMEYLIKTYTNEGETVLDFTMGSGTTGVACINTNRNFIGIEKNLSYFNLATDRIHASQPPLLPHI